MPQNYPGGIKPTPELGPRSVPVPWDQSHYTSDPTAAIPATPQIPDSPWQTNFAYDPNWTGTLRYRLIGSRLLAIEGTATPTTSPPDNTPVPLGTMPAPNIPDNIIRLLLSAQAADRRGEYVIPGVVAFYPDGSVTVVYGSTTLTGGAADFAICGILPLD